MLLLVPFRYSIMLHCWCENADKRPSFSELVVNIATSLNDIAGYVDFSGSSVADKEKEEGHLYNHLGAEQDQDAWELCCTFILLLVLIHQVEVLKCVFSQWSKYHYRWTLLEVTVEVFFLYFAATFFITNFQVQHKFSKNESTSFSVSILPSKVTIPPST